MSAPLIRAMPQPIADAARTPGTSATALVAEGLKPSEPLLALARYRSAVVELFSRPENESFSDAENTPMLTTKVRPIIRAVAVDAVRRGLRIAFCRARSPGTPRSRSGQPIAAASGRAATGARVMTPIRAAGTPSPSSLELPSPYSALSTAATPPTSIREPITSRFFDGGREPGVASRSASTGSTLVARRAGTSAATRVTRVPTMIETQMVRGSICIEVVGRLKPRKAINQFSPLATPIPRTTPTAEAPTPSSSASPSRFLST